MDREEFVARGAEERAPRRREPEFRFPDGWRQEARDAVTLETKIPEPPRPEHLLPRPDPAELRQALDRIDREIEAVVSSQETRRAERKRHLADLRSRNKGAAETLREKRELKKTKYLQPLTDLKARRQSLSADLESVNEKIAQIKAKAGGKPLSRDKLMQLIAERTQEYQSRQYTATEEVRVLQAIDRLKEALSYVLPYEELKKRRDGLRTELDRVIRETTELVAEMKPLNAEIQALAETFDQQKQRRQDEAEAETARPVDDGTRRLSEEIDALGKKRKELLDQRRQLQEDHRARVVDHQKQRFEQLRLEEMRKHQGYLRILEREKREAEEAKAREREEREKEKERLQFKYHAEIALCDRLKAILGDLLRARAAPEVTCTPSVPGEAKQMAEVEEMPLLVGKKSQFKEEEPVVRHRPQRRKKTAEAKSRRLFEDYTVMMLFDQLKILAPATPEEAQTTLRQLDEKKESFLRMREAEIARAEQDPAEATAVELSVVEKEAVALPRVFNEDDFPAL